MGKVESKKEKKGERDEKKTQFKEKDYEQYCRAAKTKLLILKISVNVLT